MEFKMMNEENVIGKSEKKVKFFEQKTIIYNEEEAEEEENSENSALFNKSGKNNDRVTRMVCIMHKISKKIASIFMLFS